MPPDPIDFAFAGEDAVLTPALVFSLPRIDHNLREMLAIAGGPERLRPHLKTHKSPALVARQLALGISKFKVATLAEAAMAAQAGAADVLVAYPVVGPAARALAMLAEGFPGTRFSALVDDPDAAHRLATVALDSTARLGVWLDLDVGMGRTGIFPGALAIDLVSQLEQSRALEFRGLHAYDGHLTDTDPAVREQRCDEAMRPVEALRDELRARGVTVPAIVAGGSPTFPMQARHADRELSPGTTVLWDFGYAEKFPDLPFLPAAVVLTRVVSRPSATRLCLDLGHKAVAAENPPPRVHLLELPDATFVSHSEEHLVVESPLAVRFKPGSLLHAIPRHICPTVALHDEALIVADGHPVDRWPITARTRLLDRFPPMAPPVARG